MMIVDIPWSDHRLRMFPGDRLHFNGIFGVVWEVAQPQRLKLVEARTEIIIDLSFLSYAWIYPGNGFMEAVKVDGEAVGMTFSDECGQSYTYRLIEFDQETNCWTARWPD